MVVIFLRSLNWGYLTELPMLVSAYASFVTTSTVNRSRGPTGMAASDFWFVSAFRERLGLKDSFLAS